MLQQRRKKGFTLAELLIVVAIIAVLVAIAVPIFVTSLESARQGVFDANKRSLKGLAVAQILGNTEMYKKDVNGDGIWTATGKWDEKGNLTLVSITDNKVAKTADTETDYKAYKDSEDGIVTISISQVDVEEAAGGPTA